MITKTFASLLGATAIIAIGAADLASAATIKNLDKSEHLIVVVEGNNRQEHKIAAQQELAGLCASSCSIYVGGDPEPYDVVAADKAEIEDGVLYYLEEPTANQPNQ